jgi:multidrug resistance efflux pump
MSIRQTLRSSAIYIAIAVITATITLVSFANKALTYQDQVGNVVLKVHKKEFKVTAQTTGTIAEVRADVGQSVKQGDVIAVITNPVLDKQIAKLSELSATNASASVQLVSLQTQKKPN